MAKAQEDQPIYESVGFDPATLTVEDIAFICLCRRMAFGTIQDVAVNQGRPTVVKTVTQRLDLTVAKEGLAITNGLHELVTDRPQDLMNHPGT